MKGLIDFLAVVAMLAMFVGIYHPLVALAIIGAWVAVRVGR